jgi:4-hydroxy-tetrahydrodipicolinate reductase
LTITETTSETHPFIAEQPIYSRSLGATIETGRVAGLDETDRIVTAEGVVLEMTLTGHIFSPGESERNDWTVKGEPDLTLTNPEMPSQVGTGAQLVNRIPDVINASPGFVTVDQLPPPRYRARPLQTYLARSATSPS